MRNVKLLILSLVLGTTTACATTGTPPPASDFCLLYKPVKTATDPLNEDGTTAEDNEPGNQYDTDETLDDLAITNEIHERLCNG